MYRSRHTLSYRHAVHRRSTTFSVVTFAEAGTCGIRTHLPWAATDAIWMTMRTTVHNFAAIFQQEKQSSPCDEAASSGPLSHRSVAACRLQWPEPRRNNFRRGWKASVRWTWERAISQGYHLGALSSQCARPGFLHTLLYYASCDNDDVLFLVTSYKSDVLHLRRSRIRPSSSSSSLSLPSYVKLANVIMHVGVSRHTSCRFGVCCLLSV